MATRRQPLIPGWLVPWLTAATLMVAVAPPRFWHCGLTPRRENGSRCGRTTTCGTWCAFLSGRLFIRSAVGHPGDFPARALYRRRFPRRLALLRLCAMTLILPVLVAVFGILSVYGRQGWLASLWHTLGLEWTFSPYGLQGILLAHVFFQSADGQSSAVAITGKYSRRTTTVSRSVGYARLAFLPLC